MSSPSSHLYETLYVLKAGISDADAATIHQKVDTVIAKFQGKISTRDDWGTKELAYPIEKEKSGKYNLVIYSGTSGVVEEIERHFKILDDVIRYITVSVDTDYDYANVKKQIATAEEELAKAREFRKKEGGFGDRGGFRDREGGGGFRGDREGGGGFRDRDGGGGGGFRGDRGDGPRG